MSTSTLTSNGRVIIPQEVRESLRLHTGDKLSWEICGDGTVVVRKARRRTVAEMAGLLGKPKKSAAIAEMDAATGDYSGETTS